ASQIAHRSVRDHEAAEQDLMCLGCRDDALRSGARALHDAATREVELLDRRRWIADVEAGDRPTLDLAGEEERWVLVLHRERLLVTGDEDDLAGAGTDAEGRGGERAEDVDDHRVTGRRAGSIEQRRAPDDHVAAFTRQMTAAVNGRRPEAKRSSDKSEM